MSLTMEQVLASGSFPGAYVFHIAGYPWCATNSPALKTLLDDDDDLRKHITGDNDSSYDLAVLLILDDDQGSQSVQYGPDTGIDVGQWSARLRMTEGHVFSNESDGVGYGINYGEGYI